MKAAVRKTKLLSMVPLSEYAIDKLEKAGDFPKRFPLTSRVVAWDQEEVEAWLDARKHNPELIERDPSLAAKNARNPNHLKAQQRAEAHAGM